MRSVLISLVLCSITCCVIAQNYNSIFYRDHNISASDSNDLYLDIENANIFKNNEYFNYITQGYTLIGYIINPRLTYYPFSRARIDAGIHLLKYSGLDNFTRATPIFTFQYKACKGIDIVMGTLYGSLNHRLIEPVYRFEGYMENNIENGMQLLIDKNRFRTDVWLSWEKFIFTGDPFREEFTIGTSSEIFLNDNNKKISLSIPVQTLVFHKGGQITSSQDKLSTLTNTVTGIRIKYLTGIKYPEQVGINGYYVIYEDLSPIKLQKYSDGDALYPDLFFKIRNSFLHFGYWYAEEYIAPGGEPVFQSISQVYASYWEKNRELLTAKFIYNKNISRDISLGLRFEFYYDIINNIRDFSYGFHIVFNRRSYLEEIK